MPSRAPSALALAFALTLVASGCGKDEADKTPATPPSTEPGPAAPAADRARDEAPTPTPSPAAEQGEAAEPAKDEAAKAEPAKAPEPSVATPAGPLSPVSLPSFDPAISAVVGTPSLASLIETFAKTSTELGADQKLPPRPLDAALEALRMRLHLVDVAWLDTSRPVRLATPDPKAYPDGTLVVLPIRGGEAAVKKGLGDGLSPAEGHLGRLDVEGHPIFLDLLDEHLVATSHDGLVKKVRPWLKDVLLAWTPPDLLDVEVSVSHLRAAYADELRTMQAMVGRLGEQLTQRAAIPVQAATLRAMVDGAFGFVEGTDRLGVAVVPSGDHVHVAFGLRGVSGSALASDITALAGRKIETLGVAAATTWFGVGTNLPSAFTQLDRDAFIGFLTAGENGLDKARAEKLADHAMTLTEVNTGDSTFTVGTDGKFPFAFSSLALVKDRVKAREAVLGILSVVLDDQLAKLRKRLADSGAEAKFELNDLADLVKLANTMGEPLGAKLEVVDESRGDVAVKALVATVDWERLGVARSDPGFFAAVQAMVGPKLSAAMADGEGRVAVSFGPHGVERAAEAAAGKLPGGEPNLTRAGEGAVAAVSLRVGAMLQALSVLPSMKRYADEYAKLPTEEAITLQAAVDGETLKITADVALDLFRVLVR